MNQIGDHFELEITFTQAEVNAFAKVSGDLNPIHWDEAFAANTPFKKPIIHGAFITSIFSRVMGMEFPGKGSIYLSQQTQFKRPMYVGQAYRFYFELLSIDAAKHSATYATQVFELERNKITVDGQASLMNTALF